MNIFGASRAYIEAFVSALSNRTDIQFIESNEFGVDLKNKIFKYDALELQRMTIQEVKGVLLHEIGHLNYSSHIEEHEKSEEFKKYPHLSSLYNVFEDIRIEHLMIKEFGNFALYPVANARLWGVSDNYFNIKQGILNTMTPYNIFCGTMATLFVKDDYIPLRNIHSGYNPNIPFGEIFNYANACLQPLFNTMGIYVGKLKNPDILIKMIDGCKNTQDIMRLVDKEIVPYIRDLLEQEAQSGNKPESMHGEEGEGEEEEGKEGKKLTTSHNLRQQILRAGTKGGKMTNPELPSENDIKKSFFSQTHVLAKYLEAILEEKTTIKYQGSYKRGRLIPRNVYKVKTKEHRLYSKRNHPDKPQYEVTFVIDESGSMEDYYEEAYTAAVIIDTACKKLGFKVNYIGFDGEVYVYKELPREIHNGGTRLDQPLKQAKKMIDPDNDNIIFIITDGEISTGQYSPKRHLEALKKMGVTIMPIGLNLSPAQKQNFKCHLPNAVFAKEMTQLVKAMAKFLKDLIHR